MGRIEKQSFIGRLPDCDRLYIGSKRRSKGLYLHFLSGSNGSFCKKDNHITSLQSGTSERAD